MAVSQPPEIVAWSTSLPAPSPVVIARGNAKSNANDSEGGASGRTERVETVLAWLGGL